MIIIFLGEEVPIKSYCYAFDTRGVDLSSLLKDGRLFRIYSIKGVCKTGSPIRVEEKVLKSAFIVRMDRFKTPRSR